MRNPALSKLEAITALLKESSVFHFSNFNWPIFLEFLDNNSELSSIVANLIGKYPEMETAVKKVIEAQIHNKPHEVIEVRKTIKDFDQLVAYCVFYLKELKNRNISGNHVYEYFYEQNIHGGDSIKKKDQFFVDCIETIKTYLTLQIDFSLNAVHILQRYKILCEWYERDKLFGTKEVKMTQGHLDKYLFDQGFTYSLSETSVPSGRIDNFALNLGFHDKKELSHLPDSIVAESKIFDGTKKDVQDVKNQALKRAMDLNFHEVYCVLFNKTDKKLNIQNADVTNGLYAIKESQHRILFIIVNLHEAFSQSTSTIEAVDIELK